MSPIFSSLVNKISMLLPEIKLSFIMWDVFIYKNMSSLSINNLRRKYESSLTSFTPALLVIE